MSNEFSKEERVAFEQEIMAGFEDALVMSNLVGKYGTDGKLMERTNDTMWRPVPYIAQSQDRIVGTPITPQNMIQLSVPATLGYKKSVPLTLDALELRDALQENRLGKAAYQKLASDINVSIATKLSLEATLAVAVAGAAGDYDDVALCDTIMNERGIPSDGRIIAFNSRDYNGLAGNLATSTRSFGNSKSDQAYEKGLIGRNVAGFDAYKLDNGRRIAAAAGGATNIDTQASASNYYVPKATNAAATGEVGNVDNRYQTVTVDNTAGVAAGDAFTISGINSVHMITKEDTGQPMTFRVISITNGTQMVISPPIISNQGGTDAEAQWQNCVVTPSASAAFNWLNDNATGYNVFWRKDSVELLAGRYAVPTDAGVSVLRGTVANGIEIVMTKKFDNATFKTLYTFDVMYGVAVLEPQHAGILLFNQ